MYKIEITQTADKDLKKIKDEKTAIKIRIFLENKLPNVTNPKSLKNATKMKDEKDKYRWRIGDYRIIGIVKDNIPAIEIIKIAHRKDAYK